MHILNRNIFYKSLPAILVSLGMVVVVALAWTEPATAPPGGNVSAPLNVGSGGQSKIGGLILNTGGAPNGLIVQLGKVGIGTTTPLAELDVNGWIHSTGGLYSEGKVSLYGTISQVAISGTGSSAPVYIEPNWTTFSGRQGIYEYLYNSASGDAAGDYMRSINLMNKTDKMTSNFEQTGIRNLVYINNPIAQSTARATGIYNEINTDGAATAYGTYNYIDPWGSGTSYGEKIEYNTLGTGLKWGLYVTGEQKNYFSGNVGIGTTTPAQKLDVAGTVQMTGLKLTTSPASGFVLTSDAAGVGTWQASAGGGGGGWTDDGTVVRLTAITDNVGIGTATPQRKLHIVGDGLRLGDGGLPSETINFGDSSQAWIGKCSNCGGSGKTMLHIGGFAENGVSGARAVGVWENFYVLNGNVGIGTANPGAKLEVSGGILLSSQYYNIRWPGASATGYIQNDDGYNNRFYIYQPNIIRLTNDAYGIGGGNSGLFVTGNNVGIGTTNPGAKLDVNGNIYDGGGSLIFSTTAGTHTGIGNTAGWAAIENAANYNTLMILGRSGGIGGGRSVSLWDRLDVNGTLCLNGVCRSAWSGGSSVRGSATWSITFTSNRNIWVDATSFTITPGSNSGTILVFANANCSADDQMTVRVLVDGVATSGYRCTPQGSDSVSINYMTANTTASAKTIQVQGYINGGSNTDYLTDGTLYAVWMP
ncbi:MAG: hypothetical protein Q7S60_04980 [bacterium]|nr:hypothetical protein [bacterium]